MRALGAKGKLVARSVLDVGDDLKGVGGWEGRR